MENLNELKPVGKLSPFTRFCCTIGNIPTSYMISLSYEEQLLWLCNYLEKTVIPAVNTNAEAIAEIQALIVELKNYVDNYFENLDVQEEINRKLDEMARNGDFDIILQNLFFTDYNNKINNLETNTNNLQETKIDKDGVEQVKYTNLSQEIKEMFTGGSTPVVAEDSVSTSNIVNKSVTPNKTSFLKMLDLMAYTKLTSGYHYNNTVTPSETMFYTEKIAIQPNTKYRCGHRFIDFYNADNMFLSGVSINNPSFNTDYTFTSPANAYYAIISYNPVSIPNNYLVPFKLNHLYENFGKYELLDDYNIGLLKKVAKNGYNGYFKNLNNDIGYYIGEDGELIENQNFFTTPIIEVVYGDTLKCTNVRTYAFYNEKMELVQFVTDSTLSTTTIPVPANAKYFKGSYLLSHLNTGFIYSENFINFIKSNLSDTINLNQTCNALPTKIKVPINNEYIIYIDNIIPFNKNDFYLKYNYNGNLAHFTFNELDNTIKLNSNEIVNENLTLTIYNRSGKEMSRKTCTIEFIDNNFENLTGLFIGDSTIAQQEITENLLNIFNENNKTLTLLGTKTGTNPNNHYEGYSGVTANQLVNNASFNGVTNPFYNNGQFDFTYYMYNNNYKNVDFVVIQLGINDVFDFSSNDFNVNANNSSKFVDYINTIINSIKSFNSSIKIFVDLIIPPNGNLETFNNVYKNTKMHWIYKLGVTCQNMFLINNLNANILIDTNLTLNSKTDIADGVHPNTSGYLKISNTIKNYIL